MIEQVKQNWRGIVGTCIIFAFISALFYSAYAFQEKKSLCEAKNGVMASFGNGSSHQCLPKNYTVIDLGK